MAAPARRALENKGITALEQLTQYSEAELLQLNGMAPGSLPKLKEALKARQLSLRK